MFKPCQSDLLRTSLPLVAVITLTACGGGASTPPSAQAQASGNNGVEVTTELVVTQVDPDPSMVPTNPSTNESQTPEQTSSTTGSSVDLSTPVLCTTEEPRFRDVLLELVNNARSQARLCGTDSYPAVADVTWNETLKAAAVVQSIDMTEHNFFSHTGSDGSDVGQRVELQGYEWRAVGENIAAGQQTAQEVINGWLGSAGHCRNLMNASYTEVAVACVENNNADYVRYWTNVLAAPLR